jgi:hypothetical protein
MTVSQLSLLTAAEPPANRTPTSIRAARKVKENGKAERDRRILLNLIRGAGPIGRTMKELQEETGVPRHVICARAWELRAEDRKSRALKLSPLVRWEPRLRREGCAAMVAV